MHTKHKGAVAVGRAVSHFSTIGYAVFLPVGDGGGEVDLVVSPNGQDVQRVQCKYTSGRHSASVKRDPESRIWQVNLRSARGRMSYTMTAYEKQSFDLLYVVTPDGDYLFEWAALCDKLKKVPTELRIGKNWAAHKLGAS
jgi:hypothetical protein